MLEGSSIASFLADRVQYRFAADDREAVDLFAVARAIGDDVERLAVVRRHIDYHEEGFGLVAEPVGEEAGDIFADKLKGVADVPSASFELNSLTAKSRIP